MVFIWSRKCLDFLFDIKDLEILRYFVGIEVASPHRSYLFSQSKYSFEMISRACLINTQTIDTSLELNAKLSPTDDIILEDCNRYREIAFVSVSHGY